MIEELKEIYFDIQNKSLLLDLINLEAFNFGSEVINNIFQTIENEMIMDTFLSKTEEVIPFKGGLPKTPLIVGLAGVLPDSINNLVSKFVGYQSKAVKAMSLIINEVWLPNKWPDWELNLYILQRKRRMIRNVILNEFSKLKGFKSINRRKEEFTKLPRWLRRNLIVVSCEYLFPRTQKNEIFIREQTI